MITLEYFAQAKITAGCDSESFDTSQVGASLEKLVALSCERHGEAMQSLLMSEGKIAPWLLVAVNGETIDVDKVELNDGDLVRLLSPISGG